MNVYSGQLDEQLSESKSMCSLSDDTMSRKNQDPPELHFCGYRRRSTASDSSVEIFVVNDSDSEVSVDGVQVMPVSGYEEDMFVTLEHKIDRLTDLFLEQCKLLTSIKDEIQDSKDALEKSGYVHSQLLTEIVNKTIEQRMEEVSSEAADADAWEGNSRARSLLSAIEVKRACSLDQDIREALTAYLQSDELCERVVSSTSAGVRDVVRACVSRDVSGVYLPVLERSHRRLLRHVSTTIDEAFSKMEENSSQLSKQIFRASRNLRRTLEKHLSLMEAPSNAKYTSSLRITIEELLDKELKQWRQKVLDIVTAELQPELERSESPAPFLEYTLSPISPPQPADPELSIIDQLMQSAEINKQIEDGDLNGSFERALSASDLSLVMVACRAADPAKLIAPPCPLTQSVLLSLAQQLATDMVHETQLKCRYLEEAIINLNPSHPATRAHLPMVVEEIRKHLKKFLLSYPNHVASRRVTLIIMAAENLLKVCY